MRSEGFTLVEFVIVIIIVGILSIIAVPVYRNYIEKINTSQNIPDVEGSVVEKIPLKKVSTGQKRLA
jgi:prepilin-type N-terminal cleavage/methylation domain-containing protein